LAAWLAVKHTTRFTPAALSSPAFGFNIAGISLVVVAFAPDTLLAQALAFAFSIMDFALFGPNEPSTLSGLSGAQLASASSLAAGGTEALAGLALGAEAERRGAFAAFPAFPTALSQPLQHSFDVAHTTPKTANTSSDTFGTCLNLFGALSDLEDFPQKRHRGIFSLTTAE